MYLLIEYVKINDMWKTCIFSRIKDAHIFVCYSNCINSNYFQPLYTSEYTICVNLRAYTSASVLFKAKYYGEPVLYVLLHPL